MFRFLILTTLIVIAAGQGYHQDPKTAAIISEQRYLSGDGKFGAAYTQEDGINFKEETDADGTRHGSYSYVDPTGQRRTISYTAGKNGFQAAGDHLPVAPPAPPQPVPQPGYVPQPQYQPQSQYQPQAAPASSYRGSDYGDDGSYDPRYNDPNFSQNSQPYSQPQYRPQPPPQPAYNPPAPGYSPPAPQYNNAPAPQYNPQPQYQPEYTTPNPHRFAPPGKLSLNRTPDGFTYSFNKVR